MTDEVDLLSVDLLSVAHTPEHRDTLKTIREAFELDRKVWDLCFPPVDDHHRCRYCGAPWQHWANSRFDGHVRCAVSIQFQRRLAKFIDENIGITYSAVGIALEVQQSIVRAWWRNVHQPARGPRVPEDDAELTKRIDAAWIAALKDTNAP